MDPWITLLSSMALAVTLFAMLSCLVQTRDRDVFHVLSAVFAAACLMELGTALSGVIASAHALVLLQSTWIIGATSFTPLFSLYVWRLTRDGAEAPRLWPHAIVPLAGLAVFASVLSLPPEMRLIFFTDADGPATPRAWWVGAMAETVIYIILPLQWGVYLIAITRRLTRYRTRLRDLFASTQARELRWIGFVLGVFAAYWAVNVVFILTDIVDLSDGVPDVTDQILNLVLCSTLAIWGLRQRPGLQAPVPKRYAKSALDTPRATRIAAKLRHAMESDTLYLDANLSLWALSSHIGVTDNYVSQTLNEEIALNFFDFVNGYRIEAAMVALAQSDDTILAIAYDVGFNSRSSFYTAFRKVTGQTPSAFRAQSVRSGPQMSAPGDPDAKGV